MEPSLGRFAFLTRWHSLHLPFRSCTGPFISPDSNHSSRNSTSKKNCFAVHSHDHGGCLRFHSVIARRRYTGSSAPADSADCRFGDMVRGREGRKEGEVKLWMWYLRFLYIASCYLDNFGINLKSDLSVHNISICLTEWYDQWCRNPLKDREIYLGVSHLYPFYL